MREKKEAMYLSVSTGESLAEEDYLELTVLGKDGIIRAGSKARQIGNTESEEGRILMCGVFIV